MRSIKLVVFCLALLITTAASADIVTITLPPNNPWHHSVTLAQQHARWADGTNPTFRVRFNLLLNDGRVADTELSFSSASLLHFPLRGVYLVPGSIGPIEFFDSGVDGFDAGDILAQAGFIVATSDLPGDGASSGPANGQNANAAYLGDFFQRVIEALVIPYLLPRWDVYGEEGTGGNTVLLLSQHPDIIRTVSGGAQIYHVLTPGGQFALLSPQQQAFLGAFPNGYLLPPGSPLTAFFGAAIYPPFFAAATPAFQTAACGGVGCPGPTGFLFTGGPYPSGIFYDALTAFGPGGSGYVVRATGAMVPGFFQQGGNDFLAQSPDDVNALVSDYGSIGGGHATSNICAAGFHFIRTDAPSGNGPTSCFWSNEITFLNSH